MKLSRKTVTQHLALSCPITTEKSSFSIKNFEELGPTPNLGIEVDD